MKSWELGASLACAAAAMAVIGCTDHRHRPVPVSGQVLIDGTPLANAMVQVIPTGSRPAMGQANEQGYFTLTTFKPGDGCVTGTHRVVVVAVAHPTPTTEVVNAPERYMDPGTTDLQAHIEGPTDDLELHLTWGDQKGPITRSVPGD